MDTITTTIARKWIAKIVDGSKRVEYRDIKPYWTSRLSKVGTPFRLVLRNGMIRPIPVLTVRIDKVVPDPRRAGSKREGTYALHIGQILKLDHWDRKKKRPK